MPDSMMKTQNFCRIEIKLGTADMLGLLPSGARRVSRIVGGASTGGLTGEVLAGGADWQTLTPPDKALIDARFLIKTAHGIVSVHNIGMRRPDGEGGVYFRGGVYFEVAAGPADWINHTMFVSGGTKKDDTVTLTVEALL